MNSIKWDIQTVGFSAKEELVEYTKEKVGKMTRYWDEIVGAEVYLKAEQVESDENKVAQVKLNVPGADIYAEHQSSKFEHSILEACKKLKPQIEKMKNKR